MAQSLIRWKRSDYSRLSHAVRKFNNTLRQQENLSYLPDIKDYQEIKRNIYSRSELNRIINSLKRINKDNALDLYVTKSGEELTKWEANEIKRAKNRALKNINREIVEIQTNKKSIGMGDERLRELEATKKSIENIEKKKGYEFERAKERLYNKSKMDFKLKLDEQFRINFYKGLEGVEDFENYQILKKKLDSIKNPTKFYEFIKQSEIMMDLLNWYSDKSGTVVYGAFATNEEAFNRGLEDLGLL